jgi:Cu-Zn family superoxide dismutase
MTFRACLTKGIVVVAFLAVVGSVADAQSPSPALRASVVGNAGKEIGELQLLEGPKGLVMRLTTQPGSVSPGWHGIHLHAVGTCEDPEKFELSKAHINHSAKQHGLLNPQGPDDGDLPNVYAGPDGAINAEIYVAVKLGGTDGLKDADGAALIIHANADDYLSQPIGGAGARIACAAIK